MKKKDKDILVHMVEELDFTLIPVCYPIDKNHCHQHGEQCNAAGKRPLLAEWEKQQSTSKGVLNIWLNNNDNLNFGLILGQTKYINLVGIDVDGDYGREKIKEFEENGKNFPDTIAYRTGNGMRLLYELPDGMKSKKVAYFDNDNREKGELAFICNGQQTVIPPSKHNTGSFYRWIDGKNPMQKELAKAPKWMSNLVRNGKKKKDGILNGVDLREETEKSKEVAQKDFEETSEGGRHNAMTRVCGSLISNHKMPKNLAFRTLKVHNQENMKPPLPLKEVETILETLWAKEGKKMKERKKMDNKKLTPYFLANEFLKDQKKKDTYWIYSNKRDMFYKYDEYNPPWERVDEVGLKQKITQTLITFSEKLIRDRTQSEVIKQLKVILYSPENRNVFDIGKNPIIDKVFLENGVLDTETLELAEWSKNYKTTIQLPVKWVEDADKTEEYKMWENLLRQWLPDEASIYFLQEFIGYTLTPNCKKRKALFLHGGGRNGKSMFLEVVSKLFGDKLSELSLKLLTGQNRFKTAKLMNKLVNISSDISSDYLEETSIIKRIVAGETINAEIKYGASFEYTNTARLIFSANKLPRTTDNTKGWYSRWEIVEFPNDFEEDDDFYREVMDTFSTEKGKSALLMWAVKGLVRLNKEGFTNSEEMLTQKKKYKEANDSVLSFANDCFRDLEADEEFDDFYKPSMALYNLYKKWSDVSGKSPKSLQNFVLSLKSMGYEKKRKTYGTSRKMCMVGVSVREFAKYTDFNPKDELQAIEFEIK